MRLPTEKQIIFLKKLNYKGDFPETLDKASDLISELLRKQKEDYNNLPPTEKQVACLKKFNHEVPATRGDASAQINYWVDRDYKIYTSTYRPCNKCQVDFLPVTMNNVYCPKCRGKGKDEEPVSNRFKFDDT